MPRKGNGCTEELFLRDVAQHSMQIYNEDGVYRTIKFRKPDTICYGFDLITWPGYLCFCGDMGTYVFRRLHDMFQFFRHDGPADGPLYINLGYWAEKCEAKDKHGGIVEFSAEAFEARVREAMQGRKVSKALWSAIKDEVIACADDGERDARQAMEDFKWEGKRYFHDVWEYDFTEYTFRFTWCCYAIAWGVRQYDQAKLAEAV